MRIVFKNYDELKAWLLHCSYRWSWDYDPDNELIVNATWL